jgi:hypothetical protein
MSGKNEGCQKPKELKGKPQECSPEQIRKCHGDAKKHSCVPKEGKRGK